VANIEWLGGLAGAAQSQFNNQLGGLSGGTIWSSSQLSNKTIAIPMFTDNLVNTQGSQFHSLAGRAIRLIQSEPPKTIREKLQAETNEWLKDVFT
jgi:hypothetical protein